jgi:hypothetical protein
MGLYRQNLWANLWINVEDSTFCGGEFCREQPYAAYEKFPMAKTHDVKIYEKTGHLILYHYSGPKLIADTLAFLDSEGF